MKKNWISKVKYALVALLVIFGCIACGSQPDNIPYEPDTPAPAPHEGLFVSDHGTMRFNGDGLSVSYEFDEELASLIGLPAGEQRGTYEFLGGELPIRYDTAHEMQITVGEQTAVVDIGLAAENGKSTSSGVGIVTPTRIPMLFQNQDDGLFSIVFWKEGSIHSIEHFVFTESAGSNYDDAVYFELKFEDGTYKAVIKPKGVKEKKTRTVTVDRNFVEQLENVLNEHSIADWNGFDEQEADVMDGIGFVMYIEMEDGTKVEARGYMEWPDGYIDASAAIQDLFLSVYKK